MADCLSKRKRSGVMSRMLRRFSISRHERAWLWRARSSRPLPSASRRRACSTRPGAPNGDRNLPHQLFGETPNSATGTVALPFPSWGRQPASPRPSPPWVGGEGAGHAPRAPKWNQVHSPISFLPCSDRLPGLIVPPSQNGHSDPLASRMLRSNGPASLSAGAGHRC